MSGFRPIRRGLMACAFTLAAVTATIAFGPTIAAAATVRITRTSAAPAYVSRFVAPKRVTVRYTLSAPAYVTVTVSSASGLAKRIVNNAYLPAGPRVAYWDLKRYTGAWAGNGRYTISVSAKDRSGHAATPNPAQVYTTVDNTPPSGSVSGVSPYTISPRAGQAGTITYRLSDNITTARLTATLEIVNPAGGVVRNIVQAGVTQGLGRTFVWNGRASSGAIAAPGAYSARVRIRDLAGNVYASPTGFSTALHVNAWSRERALDPTAYTDVVTRADTRDDLTHIVWNNRSATGNRIRYRRLDRFGNTVVAPVVVATVTLDAGHTLGVPDVSADASGGAYVVWRGTGRTTSYRGIWLARIEPSGRVAWAKRVLSETYTTYDLLDPRVSASASGIVHVVCWKTGGPSAIYYAAFRSDGNDYVGWTALASSSAGGERKLPNVQVDAIGRVHVAWYDAVDHPGNVGRREVYYTRLVYSGGYVSGPGSSGTISRRRLTTTTYGYSPTYSDAPEMAVDTAGSLHVAWPDQISGQSSKGIRYLRVSAAGAVTVASKLAVGGSAGPLYGHYQAIAALPGGGARLVCAARAGTTSPYRLWQADVSAAGAPGRPFCISNSGRRTVSTAEDVYPSLGTDSNGVTHLVFAADSGTPLLGATQQRVTYRDLAADPAANDIARGDLQIDAAHVVHVSSPAPPRQNTPVSVQVEVRNAGWAPMLGGTATLRFEGMPVGVASVPPLSVEATALVSLDWTVPDDATRTPAALAADVAPLGETTQTAATNDSASIPLAFLIPPTETTLLAKVCDETYDENRTGAYPVATAIVTLWGTTADGAAYAATATPGTYQEFLHVPLGTYTVRHIAPGFLVSPPAELAVTIARDPEDRYRLVTTPANLLGFWTNRWGSIVGTVHESLGTTPVADAKVVMLESGATSITPAGGGFRFGRLCEGPLTIRVSKPGFERRTLTVTVSPAATTPVDVPLVATTDGYLVGAATDEGGYPIEGASVTVKRTGVADRTVLLPDGLLDIKLLAGDYTLDFSAPGFKPVTGVTVTIVAGVDSDGTTALDLDVSSLMHKKTDERWVAPWTMQANWFGSQPPKSPIPSYSITQWYGLFRFTFDGDYQRAGLNDYIRYVKPRFVGEMWEWAYFFGVSPPVAPKVFEYKQDLAGLYDDRFQPPQLAEGTRVNRTGVRIDGIDIVDQRDWSVVSKIRSEWNSCDRPNGYLYGSVTGGVEGDGPFPPYAHTVPFDQQVVRLWITVGRMNLDGQFEGSTFGDISGFNQGQLMQASGYNKLQLFWRPVDGYRWVEPALVDYPTPGY